MFDFDEIEEGVFAFLQDACSSKAQVESLASFAWSLMCKAFS